MRWALSRYSDILPHEFEFSKNSYGRPELISPPKSPDLRFNLSHTDGMAVVAVTLNQDIGVDVESIDRKNASLEIADRFFSASEVKELFQQPKSQQRQRFFEYWTLKESFIKAKGMGLSFPLDQFSLHLLNQDDIKISFAPDQDEDPDTWRFWQLKLSEQYLIALCVDTNHGSVHHDLTVRKLIPFGKEEILNSL